MRGGFGKTVRSGLLAVAAAAGLGAGAAAAQSAANLVALEGLAPVATLLSGDAGRAALMANLEVTLAIQNGVRPQPTLLPFARQQQQALLDAFITSGNAAQLADGLGSRLGGLYQQRARYEDFRHFTSLSPAVGALFAYSNATTASDSNAGKYFLANGTMDGKAVASDAAAALLIRNGGVLDVFGKAYGLPAGTPGGNAHGNPRPFQTGSAQKGSVQKGPSQKGPGVLEIAGPDYFGRPLTSRDLLSGPESDLRDNPSFPSGHTTYGTMESMLLALLVPSRYGQMLTRGAEYGNDRILLGAHYAMDVIAGRALALHDVAHLLANDPRYAGHTRRGVSIPDYPAALAAARADMEAALTAACGDTMAACAAQDTGRFADPAANAAFYGSILTYGLPPVYPERVDRRPDVNQVAPEAGHLLTAAFPHLSLVQANAILTATMGPGGGFLDDGSPLGVYARLDLVAAGARAARR